MEFCSTNGRLLPGFRFHPMDVELVMYYLKRKVLGKQLQPEVIVEMDIYLFHPRDLPEFSRLKKDLNWYFFCPREKKYGSGARTNRATQTGYWKATGNDRDVAYEGRSVGKIKTLIFHQGKAPKGERTDWVMHEYRLEDKKLADEGVCQDSYVLCKIFKKSGLGPKNGEQYGAPFVEEEWDDELEGNNEIPICTEVLPIDAQNQCASAVTANPCPSSVSEQVYSEKVSAANMASSSMVMAQDYDDSVDQGLTPMSFVPNRASSARGHSSNYCCYPVAQGFGLMSNAAADIASTSAPPIYDDDEIDRLLDCFEHDDEFRDIFDCLGDLGHDAAQGINESAIANPYEGGLDLTDLDAPL